jgi:hypothetical protein
MEITIYRRHSADCPQKADRYAPRCGCSLSGQFNWPESITKFDGRKLKHGQNKWSLNAWSRLSCRSSEDTLVACQIRLRVWR